MECVAAGLRRIRHPLLKLLYLVFLSAVGRGVEQGLRKSFDVEQV